MKKGRSLLFVVLLVALSAVLFSCSQVGTGSVAFHFDAQFIEEVNRYRQSEPSPIPSRSALDSYINGTTYVEVKLEGDKELSQTYPLTEDLSIEFEGIPVGARIRAVLTLFSQEEPADPDTRSDICTGQSDWTVIASGENVLEITLRGLMYRIFVTWRSDALISNWAYEDATNQDLAQHDGRTEDTGFSYMQTAVNWIVQNGKSTEDYEIILTGYNEANAFKQRVSFGDVRTDDDTLTGHAKSITVSSTNSSVPAIDTDDSMVFFVATSRPVTFKNIKVVSSSDSTTTSGHIISVPESRSVNITMGQDAVFMGDTNAELNGKYGGAVYLSGGSFTMQDNATISGFKAWCGGGVYAKFGTVYMQDSAVISNCSASGYNPYSTEYVGGGAVCVGIEGSASFVMKGNATIKECSATATANGGAIFVGTDDTSRVSITSGSIKDCTKANGHGDAIYISRDGGYASLSGGIINWTDTTTCHEAVYIPSRNSEFVLSRNAYIEAPNVIRVGYYTNADYNNRLGKVTVDDNLTRPLAALIDADVSTSDELNALMYFTIVEAEEGKTLDLSHLMGYNEYYLEESGLAQKVDDWASSSGSTVQLGDIVLSDGKRFTSNHANKLTYMYRQKVVGLIFYKGRETDLLGELNLMVGTKTYRSSFAQNTGLHGMVEFEETAWIQNFPKQEVSTVGYGGVPGDPWIIDAVNGSISLAEAEFTNSPTSSGTVWLAANATLVSSILSGSNTYYPLLRQVLRYGDNFTGTAYALDTTTVENNWCIPTIAEYKYIYEAFNNTEFKEAYELLCGALEEKEFMSMTRTNNDYEQYHTANGTDYYYYHYLLDFETGMIESSSTDNVKAALPVHVYVAD